MKFEIGRVISRGFEALGKSFLPFFALSLVFAGGSTLLSDLVLLQGFAAEDPMVFLAPAYWLSLLGSMVVGAFLQAIIVRSAILTLNGRASGIGESLGAAFRVLPALIGLGLLTGVLFMIGLVLLIVPGIILYVMWIVAVPVLIEEERGVFDSMTRSRELTRGSRWPIFALTVIYSVAIIAIGALFSGLAAAIQSGPGMGMAWIASVGTAIASALFGLLGSLLAASIYVELREVKEGGIAGKLVAIFE